MKIYLPLFLDELRYNNYIWPEFRLILSFLKISLEEQDINSDHIVYQLQQVLIAASKVQQEQYAYNRRKEKEKKRMDRRERIRKYRWEKYCEEAISFFPSKTDLYTIGGSPSTKIKHRLQKKP